MPALLRRPLLTLFLLICATLVGVLGWALLGFSGPGTTIDRARAAFEERDFGACIRILELAENTAPPPSSGGDRVLAEILELRRRAHTQSDNPRMASSDLDRLIAIHRRLGVPADQLAPLRHELIRLRILAGDLDTAIRAANQLTIERPEDGRAFELLGEALDVDIREDVADALDRVERAVAERARAPIRRAAGIWLYGLDSDPRTDAAWRHYRKLAQESALAPGGLAGLDDLLRRLHVRLERSRTSYRRALALPGRPVSAYLGEARALRASERYADLELLAETYLARFDHAYAIEAAIDLIELHLQQNRPRSALEVSRRYLPRGAWRERHRTRGLDRRVGPLLRLTAQAALEAGDTEMLGALAAEVTEIESSGLIPLGDNFHWVLADVAAGQDPVDIRGRTEHLRKIWDRRFSELPRGPEYDAARLEIARESALAHAERGQDWQLRHWSTLDPDDPVLLGALGRFLADRDLHGAALGFIRRLREQRPFDEHLLAEYAEIRDAQLGDGQDSAAVLARCLALGRQLPESYPDPAILLLVAEKAHALEEPAVQAVAAACAEEFGKLYPWAARPKEIEVRAALQLGLDERALRVAETFAATSRDAEDPERRLRALELLVEARRTLERPVDDLVPWMMRAGLVDQAIANALLDAAIWTEDPVLGDLVARRVADFGFRDAAIVRRVASVLAQLGRADLAATMLQAMIADVGGRDFGELGRLALQWFWLEGERGSTRQDKVQRLAVALPLVMTCIARSAAMHEEVARGLLELDMPGLANVAIAPLFQVPQFAKHRNGSLYALAGGIHMRLGQHAEARSAYERAVTFVDGTAAVVPLALLLWRDGADSQAAELVRSVAVDGLSAAALQVRLGSPGAAATWARTRLEQDSFDAAAKLIVRAASARAELAEQIADLDTLLYALATLRHPDFARECVVAIEGLREADEIAARDPRVLWLAGAAHAAVGDDRSAIERTRAAVLVSPEFAAGYEQLGALLQNDLRSLTKAEARELVEPLITVLPHAGPRLRALWWRTRLISSDDPVIQRQALERLAHFWTESPEQTGADAEAVETLLAAGLTESAYELTEAIVQLREIDDDGAQAKRAGLLDLWYRTARARIDALGRSGGPGKRAIAALASQAAEDLDDPEAGVLAALALIEYRPGDRDNERALVRGLQALLSSTGGPTPPGPRLARRVDPAVHALRHLVRLGERERALDLLETAIAVAPGLTDLWRLRAELHAVDGRTEESLQSLAWTVDFLPGSPALDGFTILALRNGAEQDRIRPAVEALGPAETALVRDPADVPERFTAHALARWREGYPRAAAGLFQAAILTGGAGGSAPEFDPRLAVEAVTTSLASRVDNSVDIARAALGQLANEPTVADGDLYARLASMLANDPTPAGTPR